MDLNQIKGSTLIKAYGHDESGLALQFHNGRVYHFEGIDSHTVEQMLQAESPGRYFHQWIKPFYQGREIDSE